MENEVRIFFSFASQERDLAVYLQQFIMKAFAGRLPDRPSLRVFLSDTTIAAGELWEDEIKDNIIRKNTRMAIVLCSPVSITRPWVNFECGAASYRGIPIIPVCHSSLTKDGLPPFVKWEEAAIDLHSHECLEELLERISKIFRETGIELEGAPVSENTRAEFREILSVTSQPEESKEFLLVGMDRDMQVLKIHKTGALKPSRDVDNISKISRMNRFLRNQDGKDSIDGVGISIGIQNCLFDGEDLYVGVRIKSQLDAYSSDVAVAKERFNTGYQWLRKDAERKFQSIDSLQDLFVAMPEHTKKPVQPDTPPYGLIQRRAVAAGLNLWRINFESGSEGVATIFANNSWIFPRFEIGVWKFIDISLESNASLQEAFEKNDGIAEGFGQDMFLDYRGWESVEDSPVNYWIWVKDNEIFYWSYPEERLIPRHRPAIYHSKPKHAVLVKTDYMAKYYNNPIKYTPFTSDENLINYPDAVVSDQFSFPARALLKCF